MTAILEQYRPIFMVLTFGLLGGAFYLSYRPGRTAAASGTPATRVMKLNRIMLWAVTAIAVVFLFFPQVVTDLFESPASFTADMDRTVMHVEGMT